jgi:hypothetical protein
VLAHFLNSFQRWSSISFLVDEINRLQLTF